MQILWQVLILCIKAITKCLQIPQSSVQVMVSYGKENPQDIIALYKKFAGYGSARDFEKVCVIWGSMYGYTKKGVDAVVRGLEKRGKNIPFVKYPILQRPLFWQMPIRQRLWYLQCQPMSINVSANGTYHRPFWTKTL